MKLVAGFASTIPALPVSSTRLRNGSCYLVTNSSRAESGERMLRSRSVVRESAKIVAEVARALHYGTSKNCTIAMLNRRIFSRVNDRPFLTDFGLARRSDVALAIDSAARCAIKS